MSVVRAQNFILKAGGNSSVALLAILLDLPATPAWCDGVYVDGRSIFLVGRHLLGPSNQAKHAIKEVLDKLEKDEPINGVHAIAFARKASEAIETIVSDEAVQECLIDGPRGSGKTQSVPGSLAILAELHLRNGGKSPLQVLWLSDTITAAGVKTARSLEQELWHGLWTIKDDRRKAIFTIAGSELINADFVGTRDETAAERLRAECHIVCAEELVPSLEDSAGIEERRYELGITSMRLKTLRHIVISTTNPGSPNHWSYKRFIMPGKTGCVRRQIPASDRLTAREIQSLKDSFRDSPDLQKRLALGEWAAILLGQIVAEGFRHHHIVSSIPVIPNVALVFGHDFGLTPVTIIGQHVRGSLNILVALVSSRAGTRQHLESLVLPWIAMNAHWSFQNRTSMMLHFYDPSGDSPDQSNIESSPVSVIREVLGGTSYPGEVSWIGRRDPLLAIFNRLNPYTGKPVLQVSAEGCQELIEALQSTWYYPTIGGIVSRELPAKTHPASDLGDSFAYLIGGATPQPIDLSNQKPITVVTSFNPTDPFAPEPTAPWKW